MSALKYERRGGSLTVMVQGLDARELRAIIVGLALIVQICEPRSIGVTADLDHEGEAIARGIRSAFEKGPAVTVPEKHAGALLS